MANKNQNCSFCGKPKEETKRLITGPDGVCICDECVEWNEYYLGEYETKEEAERELGIIITDDEWLDNKDDSITRGGFPDWYFEI